MKKGESDIWIWEMEHFLEYIDNDVWKVIQNGNSKNRILTRKNGVVRILPPVSAVEIHAVEKERKARTILLMAIPKEHLRRFHGMDDAKEIWEAIRTSSEGLEKGYDRFQQLLSQLEAHGAEVSTEDANHKFLRSLPQFVQNLRQVTMRTKSRCLTLCPIDDLYITLGVFDKNSQVPRNHLQVLKTLLLFHTIAMISIRMKKFYKKTGRRVRIDGNKPVGFDKKKLECFKCHKTGPFARECPSKGTNDGKKRDSFYQDQGAGKKEQHQNCLLTMDDENEKLKRYRRIGMKAVKEKEQLKKTADSWKDSSKNLWKLIDSGMSSTSKVGLGYEIKSNNEVLSYEEEMNRSVFKCTAEDYINKPLYSRFTKTNSFKGVPHPLTGDYTPKTQEEIDDSLYVYGKGSCGNTFTEHSTCQSNDSEGSCGNTSEHSSESESKSISVTNEMSTSKFVITNEKVMSESKKVEPSYAKHVKIPRQQMKHQGTSEDCDYYEKKMAREAEFKKQRVFNTGNRVVKPVWTNANRVNHANHFVPRPVQLNAVRQNVNSVRPNVNTGRVNVNSVRHNVNFVRTNVNTGRSKQPVPTCNSNSFSPVRPQGTAIKTSVGYNWRRLRPNSNYNSGSNLVRTDHPLKNMEDRCIFDSGCSEHMTGNKNHLDDFEEYKGGSVTFGGSKGYITGKGMIRVGNLDFDSMSFVKELGHFNLFSISQICDKKHKVLFTETECLVVSPDFKMPDENQILL
ncbi:putative ribonuclease H-like domain-containing protein, partial [Tanacetum coccineum]